MLYPLSYEGDVADFTRSAYGDRRRRNWDPSLPKSQWIAAFAAMTINKVPVSPTFVTLDGWLPIHSPCTKPMKFRDIL